MAVNFSSDMWKQWDRNGKIEFVRQCKNILKEDQSPLYHKIDKKNGILKAIYELLSRGIRGQIRKDSLVNVLHEVAYLHSDLPSIILDVLGIIDAETSCIVGDTSDERSLFCLIVKDTDKFLSEKLLKERLEIDTLQDVGVVKGRNFYTKFIKVKTKLYYKQRRFNLFREENEGYAKLITELNQEITNNVNAKTILEIVKSLIGCFNLDPNRVLDVIIESFETRPEHDEIFIPLLKSYMPDGGIICEVLGYKFRHFADQKTPDSLYKVSALLLHNGVISLQEIYSWLSPTDKSLVTEWEAEMNDAKEFVRKLNVISTNKEKEQEPEQEKDNTYERYLFNQKWGLCEALLKIGDWTTSQQLMKILPDQSVIVIEPIAKALCNLLHKVIEPVYRSKCSLSAKNKGRYNQIINEIKLVSPPVTTMLKLRAQAFPMFIALGPSLHFDPVLLYKLIRLMRNILTEMNVDPVNPPTEHDDHELLYYDILTLLDTSVLPALSYMDCNCCVAEEIWSVIKLYPYQHRYSLYGRWKNDTYLIQPKLIRRRGEAQKQIKALMKRVSKENIKPVGRLIGKLSHCSPGFLFDYILLQIQIYDNLIGPVVDSLKYLTSLSYDVLGYCLVESLAQADRDRFKHDGTSLSMWLQSLANFCGAIYKKYNIELSGLLQYVGNQLKAQKSLDLLILKEVVQKMAGIEAAEEMTSEQLSAMSGGELLRGEAGYFSQVRNTKKSSQRLKDALASNDLAVGLCLLIAQQKHCVIYKETAHSHLKLVGKLYDQCQDTLVQFGTFLGSTYSVDEYTDRLPSIHSMLQEYHIHSDVAFFLARPMFSHQISQKYDLLRKSDTNAKKLTTVQKQGKYLEATAHVMAPIVESVKPLHQPKVWEDISPQFLVTFWSLSMYDLQVPSDSYQKEVNKLKQLSLSAMDAKDMNISKGKKEQERYVALMEKLQDERKKQQEHVDKILHRLNEEKDSWFLSRSVKSAKNETITQFLQLCLFPRCTFTALDAIYCAKFVHTIHSLKTSNFSTLLCYDRIFCDITYSVTSCTENEATRYGRFLCAMLETVMRWHSDVATFNKECANYPGFVTKFRVSNQECSEANDHVGYENYRHVCHKWHYKITKALVFCLESKDYMQIRNALIILMRILPHFPVLAKLAQIIERKVEKVREEEKNQRQDLFVLASSYIGQLKAKSGQMMRESDFHQVSDKPVKENIEVKTMNGEAKQEKKESKDRNEKKSSKQISQIQTVNNVDKEMRKDNISKDRDVITAGPIKEKTPKEIKKEERQREKERDREEAEVRKREKEKRRERKAATPSPSYYEIPPTERYYSSIDHYDHDRERDRDRDLSSVSNSSNGSTHRRSQEPPEHDRELKRRKLDNISTKNKDDLLQIQGSSSMIGGGSGNVGVNSSSTSNNMGSSGNNTIILDMKKERSSKSKDKRDKQTDEEKELRKERKLGRKRDRTEETLLADQKRRKEEEKAAKQSLHQNGEDDLISHSSRDKHHHIREKSPYGGRDHRERSHDRIDPREKQYSFPKSSRTRSGY